MYGANEYSVRSSPYNWGVSPYFSINNKRWSYNISCSYMSVAINEQYSATRIIRDKWSEGSLAFIVGFRVTGAHQLIRVRPFAGLDFSYLIDYEKTISYGSYTRHYNTEELNARCCHYLLKESICLSFPLGIGLIGGIDVSCPLGNYLEIGLSYSMKFKILNDIRNDSNPHFQSISSPVLYHNASIGVAYRFD